MPDPSRPAAPAAPPPPKPIPIAGKLPDAVAAPPKPEISRLAPMLIRSQKLIPRLAVCTEGFDATGKSRWALSCPKPAVYSVLDRGFEDPDPSIIETLNLDRVDSGVYRYNRSGHSEEDLKAGAQEALSALKRDISQSYATRKYRSFLFDTADEIWEMIRLARYGRLEKIPPMLYAPLNAEFRAAVVNDFLKDSLGIGVNVVWIHKMKKEYKNKIIRKSNGDESEVGEWTGRYERAGFKGFQYDAPNRLAHLKDLTNPVGGGRFSLRVDKCINPTWEGAELPELDFAGFASMVFPSVDIEHWTK